MTLRKGAGSDADAIALLTARVAELARENRMLSLENAHMKTAAARAALYGESKDKLIEVITAEKSRQEKFMARLLKNCPDIILTLDREYRFVNCTDIFLRFLHGVGIERFGLIKNRTLFDVFDIFARAASERIRRALLEPTEPGETVVMEEVLDIGGRGRPRHYKIHITKMFEGEEPDGAILLLIDVTDLIRAQEDLLAVNAAMKELTANISHDLKTPLTVMSVNLEELRALVRGRESETLCAKVNAAWQKNLDLQRMTQNLFEVSRIESGRGIYRPEWVLLSQLMAKVQDKYEDFLDDKGLYLDTSYGEDAHIWLDQGKVWSVFDNVVYNAARHTERGGISVTSNIEGERATVTIRDTGAGIPAADLPHVFERFYKAGGGRGAAAGDSGLGLYIVQSVMAAFGGSVAAESQVGRGTAIVLDFLARAVE